MESPELEMRRFSPSMITSLLALFVALSGTTYAAATGGSLGLGKSNSAKATTGLDSSGAGPTLAVSNTAGQPAAAFAVNNGVAPFTVSGAAKVSDLNADQLDGLDSSAFVVKGSPVDGGTDNGVVGTSSSLRSGVYGGPGPGLRHCRPHVEQPARCCSENLGGGPALELHTRSGVAPMTVDSSVKVANLNADAVDGLDASALAPGRTYTNAASFPPATTWWPDQFVAPDWFTIGFQCGTAAAWDNTAIVVRSLSGDPINGFVLNHRDASTSGAYLAIPGGDSRVLGGRRRPGTTT